MEGFEHIAVVIEGVSRRVVNGFKVLGESSETCFTCPAKHSAVLQKTAVEMQANVSLHTFWKTSQDLLVHKKHVGILGYHANTDILIFEKCLKAYCIHINAVGVGPRALEIFLQSLSQISRYPMEADELFNSEQLRMIACRSRIKPLNYC